MSTRPTPSVRENEEEEAAILKIPSELSSSETIKSDSLVSVDNASDWLLDASDPFESLVMEIVLMHRQMGDRHAQRFQAAINALKENM